MRPSRLVAGIALVALGLVAVGVCRMGGGAQLGLEGTASPLGETARAPTSRKRAASDEAAPEPSSDPGGAARSARITVVVVDVLGHPVAGAQVTPLSAAGEPSPVTAASGESGEAEIVPPGDDDFDVPEFLR